MFKRANESWRSVIGAEGIRAGADESWRSSLTSKKKGGWVRPGETCAPVF